MLNLGFKEKKWSVNFGSYKKVRIFASLRKRHFDNEYKNIVNNTQLV